MELSIVYHHLYSFSMRIKVVCAYIRFNNRDNAESAIFLTGYSLDGSLTSRTSSFFPILSGCHAFDALLHMNKHKIQLVARDWRNDGNQSLPHEFNQCGELSS
jgi:hypothetical protein